MVDLALHMIQIMVWCPAVMKRLQRRPPKEVPENDGRFVKINPEYQPRAAFAKYGTTIVGGSIPDYVLYALSPTMVLRLIMDDMSLEMIGAHQVMMDSARIGMFPTSLLLVGCQCFPLLLSGVLRPMLQSLGIL